MFEFIATWALMRLISGAAKLVIAAGVVAAVHFLLLHWKEAVLSLQHLIAKCRFKLHKKAIVVVVRKKLRDGGYTVVDGLFDIEKEDFIEAEMLSAQDIDSEFKEKDEVEILV